MHVNTNSSDFSVPDTTGPSNGIGFCGQMKAKQSFLGNKHHFSQPS